MKAFSIGCICLLTACAGPRTVASPLPDFTFLEVARNPVNFDGKVVTVRGWITVRDEDKNLWATWEDHEKWRTPQCISLIHYDLLRGSEKALDGRYVEIRGVLRADASKQGNVIRPASCRDPGIEIADRSSIKILPSK